MPDTSDSVANLFELYSTAGQTSESSPDSSMELRNAAEATGAIVVNLHKIPRRVSSRTTNVRYFIDSSSTGEITHYGAHIKVSWPKLIAAVASLGLALYGLSPDLVGCIKALVAVGAVVQSTKVKLTMSEAIVFTVIYHRRNEFGKLDETDLQRFVEQECTRSNQPPLTLDQTRKAAENLLDLDILSLEDGNYKLEDECVFHTVWR